MMIVEDRTNETEGDNRVRPGSTCVSVCVCARDTEAQ